MGNGWAALGISTTKVERMSGHHNKNLLFIGDEASGIEPEIYEAEDSLVPTKAVLIGNPIRAEGRFKELHDEAIRQEKDPSIPDYEKTVSLRVPSTASPDIDKDHSDMGLACGSWLRRMYRQYGENSLWVRTHIHALFPEVSCDVLIPEAWLDWAARPEHAALRANVFPGLRRIAVDLGEGVGKDRTVVLVRDDLGVLEVTATKTADLHDAALLVANARKKWAIPDERISYDHLGIGRKFPNHLIRYGIAHARPYSGSGSPSNKREFTNHRSECGWRMHLRFDPEHSPDPNSKARQHPFHVPAAGWWPQMREELKALTYDLIGTQTRLISKEDWCDILGRSPDLADALLQSFMAIK